MPAARVVAVSHVGDREGNDVWQIDTDYSVKDADGLTRGSFWIEYGATTPVVGDAITWGPHHASWRGESAKKVWWSFDPSDPALFTG